MLHVVGQCALNETFATAVLEASLAEAKGELAQAALRELLADEVEHARIGWTLIGSLSEGNRRAIEPWLFALIHGSVHTWRSTPRSYPTDDRLVAHGAITLSLLDRALLAGLRDMIVPGFEHLGFNLEKVHAWIAAGAPTDGSFVPNQD